MVFLGAMDALEPLGGAVFSWSNFPFASKVQTLNHSAHVQIDISEQN